MGVTLYPIHLLSRPFDDEPIDLARLPFEVAEDVRIEDIEGRFRPDAFESFRPTLGDKVVESLRRVRYALVHQFDQPIRDPVTNEVLGEQFRNPDSARLVEEIAACLRLIRPMRQEVTVMQGGIREDGTLDVTWLHVPSPDRLDVPVVQRLFALRTRDAIDLHRYAPDFLRAIRDEFWKFRMGVQFHELGHFQNSNGWKARYLLWCSAIESMYTSHYFEHRGSLVAKSRIKWFLGENTSIYAPGDLLRRHQDPQISIGTVLDELYRARNILAHGDKLPDEFFTQVMRTGIAGGITKLDVLFEAASFIVRASLLKILRDGLLEHFVGADAAGAYFGAQHLTRSELKRARQA